MKFAIVGEKERAKAWEKHLRKLSVVNEVVITGSLSDLDAQHAVLLIDDSEENLTHLLRSIKKGFHTYLVSKLPTHLQLLDKVYHASEEAEVQVQFSHWPSMTESIHWIRQQIEKPDLIQIKKETIPVNYRVSERAEFDHIWVDELALIIKWMGGNVHRYEVKPIILDTFYLGLNLTLRFENSAVATIQVLCSSDRELHQRIFSSRSALADFDVIKHRIRYHSLSDYQKVTVKEHTFNPTDTAEWSVVQFIKAIQLNKSTLFSPYDLLQTAKSVEKIKQLMEKNV